MEQVSRRNIETSGGDVQQARNDIKAVLKMPLQSHLGTFLGTGECPRENIMVTDIETAEELYFEVLEVGKVIIKNKMGLYAVVKDEKDAPGNMEAIKNNKRGEGGENSFRTIPPSRCQCF